MYLYYYLLFPVHCRVISTEVESIKRTGRSVHSFSYVVGNLCSSKLATQVSDFANQNDALMVLPVDSLYLVQVSGTIKNRFNHDGRFLSHWKYKKTS
jgi:hypothetical protein